MRHFLFACTIAVGAVVASHMPAFAEGDDEAVDPAVLAYVKARNQLGLLSYCKDKGFAGDAEIAAQKKLLTFIPMPEGVKGDAAAEKEMQDVEDQGKTGLIVDNELDLYKLADIAKHRNETEEAMCKTIGKAVLDGAAKMPDKK